LLESKKEVKDLIEYLNSQISLLTVHMAIEKLNKISSRFDHESLQVILMLCKILTHFYETNENTRLRNIFPHRWVILLVMRFKNARCVFLLEI